MIIECPECSKFLRFPGNSKIVRCPDCEQTINVEQIIPSKRGWRIASIGMILCFHYYFLAIFALGLPFGTSNVGVMVLIIMLGTPIAITGLILAITDKLGKNNKMIVLEIIALIAVLSNAYVVGTMGSIS
tara:strand:- start:571 stop:960 length:390 start_codon:yes stop_codon:yes gene_type:complete